MIRTTSETKIMLEDCADMVISCKDKFLKHMLITMFFYMHRNVSFKTFYDLRHHLWEDSGITTGLYPKKEPVL